MDDAISASRYVVYDPIPETCAWNKGRPQTRVIGMGGKTMRLLQTLALTQSRQ